jgi:RimJ/RimL family protein N-acetyltransferase
VLQHGFEAMALPEIWAQTSDSNAASTRLMARLGLTRQPELSYSDPDYPPEDNPAAVYRLTHAEWLSAA